MLFGIYKYIYIIVMMQAFLVSGCSERPFPRCVSAEDFGSPKAYVVALASPGSSQFVEGTDYFHPNQLVKWQNLGLSTTGEEIIFKANGAWTSWAKSNSRYSAGEYNSIVTTAKKYLGDVFKVNNAVIDESRLCGPYSYMDPPKNFCNDGDKCAYVPNIREPSSTDPVAGKYGAPCWYVNGCGAYMLFQRPGDPDPNTTRDLIENPVSPVVHICYKGLEEGGIGMFLLVKIK